MLLKITLKILFNFVLLLSFTINIFAQGADCGRLLPVCGNVSLKYNPQGKGMNDFMGNNLAGCFSQGENNSAWYKVRIIKDGTFTFSLIPDNPQNDYDFGIWGANVTCTNLGSPIRCNTAAQAGETGLTLTSNFETQGPGNGSNKCKFIDVKAGETYYILIDNASTAAVGSFSLNFGGTATLGEVIDADFLINATGCGRILLIGRATACNGSSNSLRHEWTIADSKGNIVGRQSDFENATFNLTTGKYTATLKVTSPSGTVETRSKAVDLVDLVTAKFTSSVNCNKVFGEVKASSCYNNDFTYEWNITDLSGNNIFSQKNTTPSQIATLPNGVYKFSVKTTNIFGTTTTKDTTLTVDVASLVITAPEKSCFENNQKANANAKVVAKKIPSKYEIVWYSENGNKIGIGDTAKIPSVGTYFAVLNYENCQILSNRVAVKEYCLPIIYVPTAFSPNGDGLNDNLRVWGKRFVNLTVEVYNQWGTVIFSKKIAADNESVTWNGETENGNPAPSGTYIVQINYFDVVTSRPHTEQKVVMIIR